LASSSPDLLLQGSGRFDANSSDPSGKNAGADSPSADLVSVTGLCLSPDGRWLAAVVQSPWPEPKKYGTSIWRIFTGQVPPGVPIGGTPEHRQEPARQSYVLFQFIEPGHLISGVGGGSRTKPLVDWSLAG
jgi:hypothetical protein